MTWNPNLPADESKIRNLGKEIRANWQALQQGSEDFSFQQINLIDRTRESLSVPPAVPSNSGVLFCQNDPQGKTQLFYQNDQNQTVQLTNGSPSGSTEGPVNAVTWMGYTFLPGDLTLVWGTGRMIHQQVLTLPLSTIFSITGNIIQTSVNPVAASLSFLPEDNTSNQFRVLIQGGAPKTISFIAIGQA